MTSFNDLPEDMRAIWTLMRTGNAFRVYTISSYVLLRMISEMPDDKKNDYLKMIGDLLCGSPEQVFDKDKKE